MKADLHLHTTASDGNLSPQELVRLAVDLDMDVIAITDHDCVDGIAPALDEAQRFPRLRLIPGVEVSTDVPHGEIHVLGYFINHLDSDLAATLERFRNSRQLRAQKMVEKLARLGVEVDWRRVKEVAGSGSIGRPHIAQVMLEQGYVSSSKDAFAKYIGREGPAYVERDKMTPEEVVDLIVKAGGLPVLAHPRGIEGLEVMVTRLQRMGLVGIEVYYGGYSQQVVKYLASLASKYCLLATGGSDYHGTAGPSDTPMGGVEIPPESVERLLSLAKRRTLA